MRKLFISLALLASTVLITTATHAENCSESYGGRLASSSPSAWAEWCVRCRGEVVRTSGSPYCRKTSKWGEGSGENIGDGPYQFTSTGDQRIDVPLAFLSGFFNELDRQSKLREARAKAEREEREHLEALEQEQRATQEAEKRELSFNRLSGLIKGVEDSGELRLKGIGAPDPLKIKTGTPLFKLPGNPTALMTAESDLKLKTGEPVSVQKIAGVPVDAVRRNETPLEQKLASIEEEMRAAEERMTKIKKAKMEAERLKSAAEERLKQAREKLIAPREDTLREVRTGPDAKLKPGGAEPEDEKLAEAEKLLEDALEFDRKVAHELLEAEKDIKGKKEQLDHVKKEIEAGNGKKDGEKKAAGSNG